MVMMVFIMLKIASYMARALRERARSGSARAPWLFRGASALSSVKRLENISVLKEFLKVVVPTMITNAQHEIMRPC